MKNLFLLVATLLLAMAVLISLEFIIRTARQPHQFARASKVPVFSLEVWTHDGKNKISLTDGLLKLITNPFTCFKNMPNQKTPQFNINTQGFRGSDSMIHSEGTSKKRIILVGGSAAFGTCVNDGETLKDKLQKHNDSCEVINAGIPGFLSGQELTYIVTELVDYEPDVIIAYNGFNDLDSQWHHEFFFGKQKQPAQMGYNTNFYLPQIERPLIEHYTIKNSITYNLRQFLRALFQQSMLLSSIRSKYDNLKGRESTTSITTSDSGDVDSTTRSSYFEDILRTYTGNLIKMNDFCSARKITFIVVLQPELGNKKIRTPDEESVLKAWGFGTRNYANEFPPLYRRFLEQTKLSLDKHAIHYIDINQHPEFAENRETLFCDVVHTNEKGHSIIAKIIDAYISDLSDQYGKQ